MGRSPYGSYRGKSGFQTFMKVLIILLLVVLVLAVAAFFLLEKYMVYSSDGAHLQLPWWDSAQTTPAPVNPETPEPTLVVESPQPTPSPTPEPQPVIHGVLLSRSALTDGTAAVQLAALGGNTAVFDMKADDGSLGYVSALQLAIEAETSAADPALNAAIQSLNSGELYTVARVSCFRDNTMPRYRNAMAIRSGGGNWRDGGSIRWLSPAIQESRQYVIGVCRELVALGFDEILLDYSGYPATGKLTSIRAGDAYDKATLSATVTAFYGEVRAALADYPEVKLSIMGTETAALLGSDPDSGQSAATLAEYADHIWLPTPADGAADYTQAMTAAGVPESAAKIVTVAPAAGESGDSWAVLSTQ